MAGEGTRLHNSHNLVKSLDINIKDQLLKPSVQQRGVCGSLRAYDGGEGCQTSLRG